MGLDSQWPGSGLWSEYARVIGALRPKYVLVGKRLALVIRGLTPFSGIWPSSGSMRNGHVFLPCALGATHATATVRCGLPQQRAWIAAASGISLQEDCDRYKSSTVLKVQELVRLHGWAIHPRFIEALMAFPEGFTAIKDLVIQSIQMSQSGLGED